MLKNHRFLFAIVLSLLMSAAGPVDPAAAQEGYEPTYEESRTGPEIRITTPAITWGDEGPDSTAFEWSTRVENPTQEPVVVKVRLELLDAQGEVIQSEDVTGQIGPESDLLLRQQSAVDNGWMD